MESVSSKIWTRVAGSIFYDNNRFPTGTPNFYHDNHYKPSGIPQINDSRVNLFLARIVYTDGSLSIFPKTMFIFAFLFLQKNNNIVDACLIIN